MKQFITKLLATMFVLCLFFQIAPAKAATQSIEVVPTMTMVSNAPNRVWVGTFQLVWNEFSNSVIGAPIEFEDYKSLVAYALNKQEFKKDNVDNTTYYIKHGIVSPKLKKTIVKGIKRKFSETSDILDSIDWTYNPAKYIVYAMLKKDFKFVQPFDKLPESTFGRNAAPIAYFGINGSSNPALYNNVTVLFYRSKSDFAVKIKTKGNDEVILYRTDSDRTFDKYYNDILAKSIAYKDSPRFQYRDTLLIPDINLYLETRFPDVEGHVIKGTDTVIDKTIETVDFKMNNEGVKLKSEAAIIARTLSLTPENCRHFNFNDTFVLFLVEKGQNVPYYAMRVDDVFTLNRTGRK